MSTAHNIDRSKGILETEKKLLEKELGALGKKDPNNANEWEAGKAADEEFGADRNDNADIFEEMQDANATITELEARLKTVVAALESIDAGTYGLCEVCQGEIEADRLAANPAAMTCKAHMV